MSWNPSIFQKTNSHIGNGIGVLTKPDTIQPGEEATWLEILNNRKYHLSHGYFMTKNAAAHDLQAQRSKAISTTAFGHRADEDQFFKDTSPWKTCTVDIKERFGSKHLTDALSRLLSELINVTYVLFLF